MRTSLWVGAIASECGGKCKPALQLWCKMVNRPGWWLEFCFRSTETVGLFGTGAQDVHLDFHTVPELCKQASGDSLLSKPSSKRLREHGCQCSGVFWPANRSYDLNCHTSTFVQTCTCWFLYTTHKLSKVSVSCSDLAGAYSCKEKRLLSLFH